MNKIEKNFNFKYSREETQFDSVTIFLVFEAQIIHPVI